MPPAIEADHLRKIYSTTIGFWRRSKKETIAVDDISFSVEKGELFGILGPNGAGKTTTVKMLTTLLLPTGGAARILGMDVVHDTQGIRPCIGFTFGGGRGLYTRLSAQDNLRYFAELYGLDPKLTHRRVPELLELVGLAGREQERVETYSSGMQQRLHLARVMLPDPDLLFLDEPTVGIDPVGSRELRRIVKDLVGLGKTVLLTTHYLYEAEELCDRIAIINRGHLVALDTPLGLKRQVSGETVIDVIIREGRSGLIDQLMGLGGRAEFKVMSNREPPSISIRTYEPGCVMEVLAPYLARQAIQGLEIHSPSLEDVYVSIIQEQTNGN
ncbi:MAG: ABC transporter ATP-binding protein [Anaerolineaceae bacterium]|nr:ABC transporter ATP-binding protein [Anaerolineaceae bacterium]